MWEALDGTRYHGAQPGGETSVCNVGKSEEKSSYLKVVSWDTEIEVLEPPDHFFGNCAFLRSARGRNERVYRCMGQRQGPEREDELSGVPRLPPPLGMAPPVGAVPVDEGDVVVAGSVRHAARPW